MIFTEMEPGVPENGGDAGGDAQVGESYSRRFTAPLESGRHLVLTVSCYVLNTAMCDEPERLVLVRQELAYECCDPGDINTAERSDARMFNLVGEPIEKNAFLACAAYSPEEEFVLPWRTT